MNKLLGILFVCLTFVVFEGCKKSILNERVQVIEGISVLMPSDYSKSDSGDGDVMFRSKVGSADVRVLAITDASIDTLGVDKLKQGLEINVVRFLEPMKGKLLNRKDTISEQLAISDFEFQLGDGTNLKHGQGKFLLKGNKFITFLFVTPAPELDRLMLQEFFNSIEIE